jgi:hypothetical protein
MEALTILLIGVTGALGCVALSVGIFVLSPGHMRLRQRSEAVASPLRLRPREHTKGGVR